MNTKCILCGKEVGRFGCTSKIGGLVIEPLCSDCNADCSEDSKKVLDEHRELFERMLAEHRESLGLDGTGTVQQRSNRERTVLKRYSDAYLVAKSSVGIGSVVKGIGVLLAVLILLGALVSAA